MINENIQKPLIINLNKEFILKPKIWNNCNVKQKSIN